MRICIHRGAHEIGGSCVEIESAGARVVLDIGLPLDGADAETLPLHPVPGFAHPDPTLLGVLISHPHLDHYGLAHRLPPGTPFLIGQAAQAILEAADFFTPSGLILTNPTHLVDRKPITLGPFTITPFLVDHSAYDSYALLVEADGRRLFYSGDFRAHGRKAGLVERLIHHPPPGVHALLMEGTTLGRPGADPAAGFATEDELVDQFIDLFNNTDGLALVWASGQNIDRLVTLYKACRRSGRLLILDAYTAHILKATGNERLPQASWDGIRIFLPKSQRWRIIQSERFDLANALRDYRIFPEDLAAAAPRAAMLFRESMIGDLEEVPGLKIGRLICSVWKGYLDRARSPKLLDWIEKRSLPLDLCHTSGHASVRDLLALRQAFPSATLVPIHSDVPERFEAVFGHVRQLQDGEWMDV